MTQKQPKQKKLNKAETTKKLKEQEIEVKRQRTLVKDVLYPFLLKNSKSIKEAKMLCYEVQTALTQVFQQKIAEEQRILSEKITSEIQIEDITKRGVDFKRNLELYNLLKDEKVSTTNALLGGMCTALDSFVQEEISNRPLESLKADFL